MAIPLHELNSDGTLTLPVVCNAVAAGVGGGGGASTVVAAPTGVATTDTANIKAALAAGSLVMLQAGTYAVHTNSITLTDQALVGCGPQNTVLQGVDATGDLLTVATAITYADNGPSWAQASSRIADLRLSSSVTRTAGYAINVGTNAPDYVVERVYVSAPYDGFNVSGGRTVVVDTYMQDIIHNGINVSGTFAALNARNLFAMGPFGGQANYIIHLVNTNAGVYLSNCDLERAASVIKIEPAAASSQTVQALFVDHCAIDSSATGTNGIDIQGDGQVNDIWISNCWIAGFVNRGIVVANTNAASTDLRITGNHISSSHNFDNVNIFEWSGDCAIQDNHIFGSAAGVNGLNISPYNNSRFIITGNQIVSNGAWGFIVNAGTYKVGSFYAMNTIQDNTSGAVTGTGTNLTAGTNF